MEAAWWTTTLCGTKVTKPTRDLALAEVARLQHGPFSLDQLLALGFSASGVRARVACGRLHRLHTGVYALSSARLRSEGRWMAAVLACGVGYPQALTGLAGRDAAALWNLRANSRSRIEVISRSRVGRYKPGIELHHSGRLLPRDLTVERRIPVTSLARTLLDIAAVLRPEQLAIALEQAEQQHRVDLRAIEDVLARNPGARGRGRLRQALAALAEPTGLSRSEFEQLFLELCRSHGLPLPLVNHRIQPPDSEGPIEVGFCWPGRRLCVETDGWQHHRRRGSFENDRRRDERLKLAGWEVLRFTWRRVSDDPDGVARTVRSILGR